MISKGKKPFKPLIIQVTGDGVYTSILPIVIRARAWVDEEEYYKTVTAYNQKSKTKAETNTN